MEHASGHAAYAEPVWTQGGAPPQAMSAASAETTVSGRAELWEAVLEAIGDVDGLLSAGVLARLAGHGGARLAADPGAGLDSGSGTVLGDGLGALHADVRDRLDRLRAVLRAQPDGDRMMLALILFVDERIMRQLADDVRLSWPLLQVEWLGSSRGGEEFYRILDRLLEDQRTAGLLLEIFYFCLSNGFVGRYAGNPAAIEDYRRRLRARIGVPEAVSAPEREPATPEMPLPWQAHPAWYYLGTAVVMVGLVVLMTALSNCGA